MKQSPALPFELDKDSIDQWLISLDRLFLSEKITLLDNVLVQITETVIGKNALYSVLDALSGSVMHLSDLLEHNALRSSDSSEKTRKWISVSIKLPKKLSAIYTRLAMEKTLSEPQRSLCAYKALQILSVLNKRSALYHQEPGTSVWKKFSKLFLLAEENQWLHIGFDHKSTEPVKCSTIDALVKQMLLFHSCLAQKYSPAEIASIHSITAKFTAHVQLSTNLPDAAVCHWRPDAFMPPGFNHPENINTRIISLDVRHLNDFLEAHPDQKTKVSAQPDLLNRLTAYHAILRSADPLESHTSGLIVGSAQAEKFLNILISRYRVLELSGINRPDRRLSHLELVPIDIRTTMASLSSQILADIKTVSSSQLRFFTTHDPAYWVTKVSSLKCSQDEPAILVQEDMPPIFSLIRHIRLDSNQKFKSLVLEKIEGEVYPFEIDKVQGFIVIRPESRRADLFLPPASPHKNGTVLSSSRGIVDAALKIKGFLEANKHFVRYEVDLLPKRTAEIKKRKDFPEPAFPLDSRRPI